MDKQDIILEIQDCDIEIERQFNEIEAIYEQIKEDTARRQEWLVKLKEELN